MLEIVFKLIYKYKKIVKYLFAGSLAAFTDLAALFIFVDFFHLHYLFASCLAFVIAFFVSFSLHKYWTFRDGEKDRIFGQMTLYLFISLLGLAVNAMLMFIFVDLVHIWYILAQILTMGLVAIGNFLTYNFVIFKKQTSNKSAANIDRPSRVLIATGIYPPDIGGPATMIQALAVALAKNNIKVKIVTYAHSADEDDKGFFVKRIFWSRGPLWAHLQYFLWLFIYSRWADVIYAADTYSVGYFTYLIKLLTGRKYILRFVGDSAWETAAGKGLTQDYILDFIEKKYSVAIEKQKERRSKILSHADRVITVSNFLADVAFRIGAPRERIAMIYNSVDFIDKANRDNSRIAKIKGQYGQGAKILATVCRLTPWKGVDGIINILPELNRISGRVNLLVLGDGQELENLKNLARMQNMSEQVFFLGKVPHQEVLDYVMAADLLVLNTNYEGLSHVLLEGMLAGTPIMASRVGGNPEVIEDGKNGLLFGYNNEAEMLRAAERILNDQEMSDRFVQAGAKKLELFDWEKNISSTIKLINKACS